MPSLTKKNHTTWGTEYKQGTYAPSQNTNVTLDADFVVSIMGHYLWRQAHQVTEHAVSDVKMQFSSQNQAHNLEMAAKS